ncbi:hypothetical protein ACFV30_28425 [Streptomyces sp. NPDC059752]|uniref:hypothetical protein n=1 Tax=unclassified Streptomyces TaxID=2593676 RepID=UPI0036604327
MTPIESIPPPEEDWEAATAYQGGKQNPVSQRSSWEFAVHDYEVVARLKSPIGPIAARLRLSLERTWEDVGDVDVAMFHISGMYFALSAFVDSDDSIVRIRRGQAEEECMTLLLATLGVDDSILFS